MTEHEAIRRVKKLFNLYVKDEPSSVHYLYAEAIKMSEEALEKQIPRVPRFYSGNYYCPDCGDLVGCHDIIMKWDNKFCKACGQKIDWGNEDDRTN